MGSTQLEHSELEPPAAHYPVDDITEKTDCELHMSMKNMSFKVAVGYAVGVFAVLVLFARLLLGVC